MVHMIVLAFEGCDGQGDPAAWDWSALTDSAYPISVVAGVETSTDDNRTIALRRLAHRLLTTADHIEEGVA